LVDFDRIADRDQHTNDIALFDVLAELGQFEFNSHHIPHSLANYTVAGFGFSGSISRSLNACTTTLASICPFRSKAARVVAAT
jgi:hypothetical protein